VEDVGESHQVVPVVLPGSIGEAYPFDATWCLAVDVAEERSRVAASWCCVADGTVGTRGVLENERGPGSPAVMAAGLYQPAPEVGEAPLALPSWCMLPLPDGLVAGRRVLDLRDGLLTRKVDGGRTDGVFLWSVRFACAGRPGTAVLVAEVSAVDLHGDPTVSGPTPLPRTWSSPLGTALTAGNTAVVPAKDPAGHVVIERLAVHVVSDVVSERHTSSVTTASTRLARAMELGPRQLLAGQRKAWAARWAGADVEIVGDPEVTLAVRFALFHVLSSAARRGEAVVGARGLTGPAYAGHVFWDTEAFVLPVLAAVDQRAARAVLEYRLRRLDAARRRASEDGERGARFPWESAHDGSDVTPRSGIDQRGQKVPILTGDLEEHITADVAWAAWHTAAWAGKWSFLTGPGLPLLVETARYWAGRLRWDTAGRAHIDRVIGPDEYHEQVNDNAFTNMMARWNLRRAAEVLERVRALGASGDLDAAGEADEWRRAADALVDGYDASTGRYEQFAGYSALDPLLATDLGTPPLAADLILGPERLAATQVVKQADVLMAHYLIPEETAEGSLAANLEHYLARCAHGSSLSPSVHAMLLARSGRVDEARDLLGVAVAVDMEDLTQTTAGGLHLANLGGIWQAVVRGFAGVQVARPDDPALVIDPRLPDGWQELRLTLRWHGVRVAIVCREGGIHVTPSAPLVVSVHGTRARVDPSGGWVG